MSANMAKVQSLVGNAFTSAIEKLAKDESDNFINDLYVQADTENGELQIHDDEEHLIEKIVIFDWMNSDEEEDAFNKRVVTSVRVVLMILSAKSILDAPQFVRPLSANLIGKDFVVIEGLFFADDDMLHLNDPSLKDLDADLNDLLANLLANVR